MQMYFQVESGAGSISNGPAVGKILEDIGRTADE